MKRFLSSNYNPYTSCLTESKCKISCNIKKNSRNVHRPAVIICNFAMCGVEGKRRLGDLNVTSSSPDICCVLFKISHLHADCIEDKVTATTIVCLNDREV